MSRSHWALTDRSLIGLGWLAAALLSLAVIPASALGTDRGEHGGAQTLALGSGYGAPQGAPPIRSLQRRLARAGDEPGPIDGRFGPLTQLAVIRFQATHGLRVDGIAGPQTLTVLGSRRLALTLGSGYVPGGSDAVRSLQRRLARTGNAPGPIDGRFGPRTKRAVMRFQRSPGLHVDGIAGPITLGRLLTAGRSSHRPQASHRARPRPTKPRPRPHAPPPRSARHQPPPTPRPHAAPSGGASPVLWIGLGLIAVLALAALALIWRRPRRSAKTTPASTVPPATAAQATVPPGTAAQATVPPVTATPGHRGDGDPGHRGTDAGRADRR
jgi:peptidoglycan hydrolase-like protein with peptidoglycan-binding domain